jgi:hypothetical protein
LKHVGWTGLIIGSGLRAGLKHIGGAAPRCRRMR